MGKELTIAQLTFVDLYDSYTLSLSSDVIAVPCDAEGDALSTKTYTINYQVRAGEEVVKSKCTEARLSTTINNVAVNYNTAGTISVTVNATARIPEDSGINITVVTDDSNEFAFNRFISFMNIKKGQDGRGYSKTVDQYAITVDTTPPDEGDWQDTCPSPTKDNPYLWNREIIYYDTYTNGVQDRDTTQARIISIYGKEGNPGKGIKFITEYYTASDSAESPVKNTLNANLIEVSKKDGVANAVINENGYYVVDMGIGVHTHYLAKFTFTILQTTNIIVKCINYAEVNYDYMLVSPISTNETQYKFYEGWQVEGEDENKQPINDLNFAQQTFKTISSLNPQDVVFENVTPGTYYIYIKIRKDQSKTEEGEKFAFKIVRDGVADWTTSDPDDYGPDYPYLWNYIEFTYTDDTTSTTPPHLSAHWGLDGEPGVSLKLVTDKGSVFQEGIEEIELSLEMYEGLDKINENVSYEWSRYDLESDTWTILATGEDNIENISYTVEKSDPLAYAVYKCTVTYKSKPYSDYETLMSDTNNVYYAETIVLNDGTLADGNCAIIYVQLYKNNKEVDKLPTEEIYYVENLRASSEVSSGRLYVKTKTGANDFQFISGNEGDIVYLLTYDYMQYFQYQPFDDSTEYIYANQQMQESHGNNCDNTYAVKTTSDKTYRLILAQYQSGYWYPYKPYDAYEYCYINHFAEALNNITFNNSKIFAIDKRKLSGAQDMTIGIYEKVYDDKAPFQYYVPSYEKSGTFSISDIWKMRPYHIGDDTRVLSLTCSSLQAVKTKYTEECFKRREDGVYIEQTVTEWNAGTGSVETRVPFFVKIASEEIGFYSSEDKTTPMVHIGNSSTNIKNSILDGNTIVNDQSRFNNDIVLTQNKDQKSGFMWTFDSDDSLSLVLVSNL